MKTQIQSIHFAADKILSDLIEEKLDKLDKIYDRIESCHVILKIDKDSKNKNKLVEISMILPGKRLFAKTQSEAFETAFEKVLEEIKKQLVKRKDKIFAR